MVKITSLDYEDLFVYDKRLYRFYSDEGDWVYADCIGFQTKPSGKWYICSTATPMKMDRRLEVELAKVEVQIL